MSEVSPGREDGELVRRALAGDPDAFGALVGRHEGWVRNLMAARLRRWQDVEEGAQESFVKAFSSLRELKTPEAFRGWLRVLAERVAVDQVRRKPLRTQTNPEEAPAASSISNVEEGERRSAVARAVESLEEPYREVVALRYDRGLSCVEIARELGVTVGAVTMRLTRAHRTLATPLAEWRDKG